jgi:hypothetical protein
VSKENFKKKEKVPTKSILANKLMHYVLENEKNSK